MNPESLNQVSSLAGKIDAKAMGQKSTRQTHKQENINNKKLGRNKNKANQSVDIELRGGNIL